MKCNWLMGFIAVVFLQNALAFEECGSLRNGYGPYDYWVDKERLPIVLGTHFTSGVESLTERATGSFGGDIDYTLRAIPNHPGALMAMVRLGEKLKTERPHGAHYSVECYFHRAMRFRPDDGTVRMVYADFLSRRDRNKEALEQLEKAQELAGDSANLHYNIALTYFRLEQYDKALTHAHRAYAMGFTLPGLRNKLQKAGKWREATPEELEALKANAGDKADAPAVAGKTDAAAPAASAAPESVAQPPQSQQ